MAGRLEGKVALVLGAGGGMGVAVPMLFAEQGAKIVVAARRAGPLEEIVARIAAAGGTASIATGDMTTEEGVTAAVAAAERAFGKLDILYNNLGDSGIHDQTALTTTNEQWRWLVDINMTGAFLATRIAAPAMQRAGGGVILHVSVSPFLAMLGNPGYAAMKAALIAYTQKSARELIGDNIRVVALCPGAQGITFDHARVPLPGKPLDRIGTAEDIAWPALFLASDEAGWITGTTLVADGGQIEIPEHFLKMAAMMDHPE